MENFITATLNRSAKLPATETKGNDMKKWMAIVLLAAGICTNMAWAADKNMKHGKPDAGEGPSAQETIEFLNGLWACEVYWDRNLTAMYQEWWEHSTLKLEGKTLKLNENIDLKSTLTVQGPRYGDSSGRHPCKENMVSVLADNLQSDVEISGDNVKLSCNPTAGSCFKVKESSCGGDAPKEQNLTDWNLNFCDADKAQRAAKAMKHLIKISGGKKSLF